MNRALLPLAMTLLVGCNQAPAPPAVPTAVNEPAMPAFVGKAWLSTSPGHARGTMWIFLPDRTLVIDSCSEPYRITKWGTAGERIRWLEDTIPIEATPETPRPNQLTFRVAGRDEDLTFVAATAPYACP